MKRISNYKNKPLWIYGRQISIFDKPNKVEVLFVKDYIYCRGSGLFKTWIWAEKDAHSFEVGFVMDGCVTHKKYFDFQYYVRATSEWCKAFTSLKDLQMYRLKLLVKGGVK